MRKIVTIAREVGSGGRELGRLLANALGYRYYDREILTEIAQQTSLAEDYVQRVVERRPQPAFSLSAVQVATYLDASAVMPAQSVYKAQREAILSLAEGGNCVVIGRCADYILRGLNPLRVFLHADIESRVRRCLERQAPGPDAVDAKTMRQLIQKMDRERAKYYDFYTGLRWGDKANYDVCVNTTDADLGAIAELLAEAVRRL